MKKAGLFSLLIVLLLGAACTPTEATPAADVNAIYTMAAETVIAELTQTAAVTTSTVPATHTSLPAQQTATVVPTSVQPEDTPTPTKTNTPAPSQTAPATPTDEFCDNAEFVVDVSVPDYTEMSPGQAFEKTWRIKNTGTCTWSDDYKAVYGYPETLNGQARPIGRSVAPGETVEVTVVFTAPLTEGDYESYWRMANAQGINFGTFFSVVIVVR